MGLSWPGVGIPKQCLAHRDLDRRVVPGLLPARSPGQVSKPGETNPPQAAPGSLPWAERLCPSSVTPSRVEGCGPWSNMEVSLFLVQAEKIFPYFLLNRDTSIS